MCCKHKNKGKQLDWMHDRPPTPCAQDRNITISPLTVHHLLVRYSPLTSTRFSMGPLPVAACWAANPRKAIIARRPFLISFSLYVAYLGPSAIPKGSK